MSQEKDKLIEDHDYDGIKELDNPLPSWWLATFYITIIFAVGYWLYYEFLGGPSHDEQLAVAMTKLKSQVVQSSPEDTGGEGELNEAELLADASAIQLGAQVYQMRCAACHGDKGQGLIGPNLTDNHWKNSKGDPAGVLKAIREGFPDKGMPPWGDIIPKEEHLPLTAFVLSLKGTNVPGGKEPEGEFIEGL